MHVNSNLQNNKSEGCTLQTCAIRKEIRLCQIFVKNLGLVILKLVSHKYQIRFAITQLMRNYSTVFIHGYLNLTFNVRWTLDSIHIKRCKRCMAIPSIGSKSLNRCKKVGVKCYDPIFLNSLASKKL